MYLCTAMTKKQLYSAFVDYFSKSMPDADTELVFETPFQLLVAVVLSAQCTDKRVNLVTPVLFQHFPTPEAMAHATEEEMLQLIHSVSYPNSKARHLIGLAKMLVEEYGGEVPDTLEKLIRLPGVGRKTANVVQSVVWDKPTMAVDTHVYRVSHRIGLVSGRCTTPLATERELMRNLPKEVVSRAHHWLILHGRYVCTARNPKCGECGFAGFCRFRGQRLEIRG